MRSVDGEAAVREHERPESLAGRKGDLELARARRCTSHRHPDLRERTFECCRRRELLDVVLDVEGVDEGLHEAERLGCGRAVAGVGEHERSLPSLDISKMLLLLSRS